MRGSGFVATSLLVSALGILSLVGCEADTRHRVMAFLFDGVPPLETPKDQEAAAPQGQAAAGRVETPQRVMFVHKPYTERRCDACHMRVKGNVAETASSLCFRCHEHDKFTGEVVHAPVAGGECLICHTPHQSAFHALLDSEPPSLCLNCHDKGDLDGVLPHALANDRICTACHDPHSSHFAGMLISTTGGRVCFNCHEPSEAIAPDTLTHEPAKEGACFSCHVSHAEGGKSHLARQGKALCGECHTVPEEENTFVHAPVAEGDCLTCHNPHGSTIGFSMVEPLPDLCWQCHDQSLMAGKFKHTAAEGGGCPQCHSPHGSKEAHFLIESVPRLCSTCHEGESEHVEEMLGERAVCTKCHVSHSSVGEKLLK